MTDKEFKPIFHILHDLPTNNDAFGPHQKIAETLATMIAGPAETPAPDTDHAGYFVALEGGWGSGKSTVVKMLRDCLGENKDIESQTIIFDAWAHSGDHLRRAFLEVLIEGLIAENLLKNPEKWKQKLEGLSGRLKVNTEKRTPTFTFTGKCFGLSLLLMPIGGLLASSALGKTPWPWLIDNLTWHVWLGLGLTFLPLFVLVLTWACAHLFGTEEQIKNTSSILFNRSDDKITIETQSDPDPNSIEFQRLFQKAIKQALSNTKRRLILVIDNLDRLPASDAMYLWRTLQTFIDKNEHGMQGWQGKLWTLVPYDRGILENHFQESSFGLDTTASKGKRENGLGHFEKIFDTSLHVPAPAPTLWQNFFKDLLTQAFPNESPKDYAKVIDLMEAIGGLDYTPRSLKRILNNAGPLYIQWRSEFSLADVVFYVLQGRGLNTYLNDEGPPIVAVLGNGYMNKMKAIEFNAPVEVAREFQLISAIESARNQSGGDGLKSIEKASRNFNQLLTWSCQRSLPYSSLGEISLCAHNLITSGIWKRLEPDYSNKLRNIFISSIEQSNNILSVNVLSGGPVSEGLIHIHSICNQISISKLIMERVITTSGELQHLRQTQALPFATTIESIAVAIYETVPNIFDVEMINNIINHVAIKKGFDPERIDALKAKLSSHLK